MSGCLCDCSPDKVSGILINSCVTTGVLLHEKPVMHTLLHVVLFQGRVSEQDVACKKKGKVRLLYLAFALCNSPRAQHPADCAGGLLEVTMSL